MITSRTDLPWWSDVTRDECGRPMDKLTFEREYEPDYNEAQADLAGEHQIHVREKYNEERGAR